MSVVLASCLAACGTSSSPSSKASSASNAKPASSSTPKTNLLVAVEPGTDYHLFDYVAKYAGIFAKNGLNVTLVQANGAAASAQFALGGSVGIFTASPTIAIGAAAAKQPLKIFAIPFSGALPGFALMGVKSDSWPAPTASVKTKLQALRGKVVGVQGIGAGVYNDLVAYLKWAGVPTSAVTIVNIAGTSAAVPALQAHRIDAYFEYTALGVALEEKDAHAQVVWNAGQQPPPGFPPNPGYAAIATQSWLSGHATTAAKYLLSVKEAVAYCEAHPTAAAKLFDQNALGDAQPLAIAQGVVKSYNASLFKTIPAQVGAAPSQLGPLVKDALANDPHTALGNTPSAAAAVQYVLPSAVRHQYLGAS